MAEHEWVKECPIAVTVCDRKGIILEMNDQAARIFESDGGAELIGTNVLDCHPEPARTKLQEIMAARRTNIYTTEKNGVKRLIYQAPWRRDGKNKGYIELVIEVPFKIPHFVRKGFSGP